MNRIKNKFSQLNKEKRKALVTFISSCDPNLECSQEILNALPSYGSDIIEIGVGSIRGPILMFVHTEEMEINDQS